MRYHEIPHDASIPNISKEPRNNMHYTEVRGVLAIFLFSNFVSLFWRLHSCQGMLRPAKVTVVLEHTWTTDQQRRVWDGVRKIIKYQLWLAIFLSLRWAELWQIDLEWYQFASADATYVSPCGYVEKIVQESPRCQVCWPVTASRPLRLQCSSFRFCLPWHRTNALVVEVTGQSWISIWGPRDIVEALGIDFVHLFARRNTLWSGGGTSGSSLEGSLMLCWWSFRRVAQLMFLWPQNWK